jgi:hypothetical protein
VENLWKLFVSDRLYNHLDCARFFTVIQRFSTA